MVPKYLKENLRFEKLLNIKLFINSPPGVNDKNRDFKQIATATFYYGGRKLKSPKMTQCACLEITFRSAKSYNLPVLRRSHYYVSIKFDFSLFL